MTAVRRRRWTLAPLVVPSNDCHPPPGVCFRTPSASDDERLAGLLASAYLGTIDEDADLDPHEELRQWRTIDDADEGASAVALEDGRPVGASLIARELGSPLLYEIVVAPSHQRCCLARTLLQRSIDRLALRGESSLSAWVTLGNVASETLLASLGFVTVTPALEQATAIPHFRAARVLAALSQPLVAAATTVDAAGATLWLIGERSAPVDHVEVAGTRVQVRALAPDAGEIPHLARTAMPLRGIDWLLAHRASAPDFQPVPTT